MKFLPLYSAALLAVGCQEQGASEASSINEELSAVKYSIPNMVCEFSCVPTVEKVLAKQPGVRDVQVDLKTKTATVLVDAAEFDQEAARADLVDVQFTDAQLLSGVNAEPVAKTTTASVVK